MNKYWSNRLSGITPYIPGEQPKGTSLIKLNTNESPYPPSPRALEAVKDEASSRLRLYPDPNCDELRGALAECHGLSPQEIFVGNGSDEILAFCFLAFWSPGDTIAFADITYSFYPVYADIFKVNYKTLPLDDDFNMPVSEFLKANCGLVIANPNAPTGIALPLSDIETIVASNPENVVIIDEAYVDFGAESAVSLIRKYPNLLVVHTFSKSRSLAGMRVGMAFGDPSLITALEMIKNSINSYTLDRIAISAAAEAVRDRDYFNETREKIIATRDSTIEVLRRIGFKVLNSGANFIFISHRKKSAKELFAALRDMGILVRYFDKPRIDNFLRVTIGTDEEMEILCKTLEKLV